MKKFLVLLILFPFMYACNNSKTTDEEVLKLQKENDSLKRMADERDATINDFVGSFNEIQENLNVIKEKEKLISKITTDETELSVSAKDNINNDIQLIYDLMKQNKKLIYRLQKDLKNSNLKISEFETMIAQLTQQIESKDMEIAQLKEELVNLNFAIENLSSTIDTLSAENVEKGKVISEQDIAINKAYYVLGTEKELKEKNIISKEGGIVGIGSVGKLKKDFNKNYFTEIDIRNKTSISINSKKADIITSHPASSFNLKKNGKITESIEISDPKAFWEASKFLVIVIE